MQLHKLIHGILDPPVVMYKGAGAECVDSAFVVHQNGIDCIAITSGGTADKIVIKPYVRLPLSPSNNVFKVAKARVRRNCTVERGRFNRFPIRLSDQPAK